MDHPVRPASEEPLPNPLYKATIQYLSPKLRNRIHQDHTLNSIIQNIRDCLNVAESEIIDESDAKAALCAASKQTLQYNTKHAGVAGSDQRKRHHPEESIVWIHPFDENTKVPEFQRRINVEDFVSVLAGATSALFDCQAVSHRTTFTMQWTFRGTTENTVVAAYAFESMYNVMAEWARSRPDSAAKTIYGLNFAIELKRMAVTSAVTEDASLFVPQMEQSSGQDSPDEESRDQAARPNKKLRLGDDSLSDRKLRDDYGVCPAEAASQE